MRMISFLMMSGVAFSLHFGLYIPERTARGLTYIQEAYYVMIDLFVVTELYLKPSTDILQSLSRLDNLIQVSSLQRFKDIAMETERRAKNTTMEHLTSNDLRSSEALHSLLKQYKAMVDTEIGSNLNRMSYLGQVSDNPSSINQDGLE